MPLSIPNVSSHLCLCQHSVSTSAGQYHSVVLTRAGESLMQLNGHNAVPRWAVSKSLCRQVHFTSLQVGRLLPFTVIFCHHKWYNSTGLLVAWRWGGGCLWQQLPCNVAFLAKSVLMGMKHTLVCLYSLMAERSSSDTSSCISTNALWLPESF